MPLTWCELECRIDALKALASNMCMVMNAPVPTLVIDRNSNTVDEITELDPKIVLHKAQVEDERLFALRYGDTISSNYKQSVDIMIELIKQSLSQPTRSMDFWSEVININIGRLGKDVTIQLVVTRPCALRCGIYKYVLWALRNFVIENELDMLELSYCLPLNKQILEKLGFHVGAGDPEYPDMYMDRNELENITEQKWKIDQIQFPAADELNNQSFADRFNIPAPV